MRQGAYVIMTAAWIVGICYCAQAETKRESASAAQPIASTQSKGSQRIPADELREMFIHYICENAGKDRSDVALSRFKLSATRPVPAGKIDYRLFMKSKAGFTGYVRLAAMVSVDGVFANEIDMSAWIDVFETVVCTSRRIQKGEPIRANDVYLARKNISRMKSHGFDDPREAVDLVARHDIREDTPLMKWMLKKDPVVERGDIVTILAEMGGIRITVPGKVLESGFQGEVVRVQNAMSQKRIYARIIDDATVAVEF